MKNNRKATLVVVLVAVILAASVGGTLAYLATKTDALENIFQPVKVSSAVYEEGANGGEFTGAVKNNVKIQNTGDIPAYIRAAVVVTWQDSQGNVLGKLPVAGEDEDYKITWTTETGWVEKDGFYYYTKPVAAGASTDVLFTDCKPLKAAPESGYKLHVEVIGSAIQASGITGATSYENAWSAAKTNGN